MLFKKTLKKSLYEIGKKKFDFDIEENCSEVHLLNTNCIKK